MKSNEPIPHPPKWLDKWLEQFCAPHVVEEVLGDLHERYFLRAKRIGKQKARRLYFWEVLSYMRLSVYKRKTNVHSTLNSLDMLTNYLLIAYRNLVKHKAFSLINILGLSIGMAVAILNGLWVYDELSFNTYHQNYKHIAQVMERGNDRGRLWASTSLQYPLATELQTTYRNHFKHILKASWVQSYILTSGETKISKTGLFIEDGAPEMFTLNMLKGTRNGLKETHSILLSASTAKALFGSKDPINQLVKINTDVNVLVTGVYEDLPHNTKFHQIQFFAPFELFTSMNKWIQERAVNDWRNHFLYLYAQIDPTTSFEAVSGKIKDATLNQIKNLEGLQDQAAWMPQIFLHPMNKWHLYSNFEEGVPGRGPVQFVWLVGSIGSFVLLLACINFMNLSTARSERRAKEVGVRKTLGSLRKQLISQFFSESYVVVLLAFILSLFVASLSLPWFNHLADKQMQIPWNNPWFWLSSLLFILITGLLAGSYPALYLSSFNPVKVLKGTFRTGKQAAVSRKVLVVMQFTISVTLIICTVIVYQQIMFAKNRPVGYTRDGLITLEMKSAAFQGKYDILRTELKKTGVVTEMSQSMGKVTEVASGNNGFEWKGKDPNLEDSFGTLAVTHDHGKTVGWQFIAGRDFSREIASDSAGIVINESAAKYMGLQNPVGEPVSWKWRGKETLNYTILGVIKDMVMESPYEPVEPTIFFIKGHNGGVNWINIKINPTISAGEALPKIEAVFKNLIPSAPFDYQFVDEEYARKFAAEERIGQLAAFFASLAILISCLGLFGLSSFTAEQRTKEIGVRKVLGATVTDLWLLLSKDFVGLVLIAFCIAASIAWYAMNKWLENFVYHIEISWGIFVLVGVLALCIALFTVSWQAIKTALLNPVNSLRNE